MTLKTSSFFETIDRRVKKVCDVFPVVVKKVTKPKDFVGNQSMLLQYLVKHPYRSKAS